MCVNCAGFIACLRNPWKCLNFESKIQALESAWKQKRCLKVLEFEYYRFLNFALLAILKLALKSMSPVLFQNGLQTSWWRQSVTCFYHYSIGECSTVHFSVTIHSKFWRTTSKIWLFVDNFGAWKMHIWVLESPWKVLEFCALCLLWTLIVGRFIDRKVSVTPLNTLLIQFFICSSENVSRTTKRCMRQITSHTQNIC